MFFEIRVVDHWRLETLGWIAEMGNDLGASADRHRVCSVYCSSISELTSTPHCRANAQCAATPANNLGFQAPRSHRRREAIHRSAGEIPRAYGRSKCELR